MCIEFDLKESVFRCVYYYIISADCLVIIGQPLKDFKNAISNCLNHTDTTYKQELDPLLTLRF